MTCGDMKLWPLVAQKESVMVELYLIIAGVMPAEAISLLAEL
jgi:hypothetical protein